MNTDLLARTFNAFRKDSETIPPMTLRAGDAVDEYGQPIPFDPVMDTINEAYLGKYFWGLSYLDPASWRHYLPHLIKYALEHLNNEDNTVDALLSSLRPPDREPPRLRSLTKDQEKIILEFLERLAFDPRSSIQAFACQVMEEWWIPNALYREDSV